ncbi:MAG TPA: sigma-70 family RNA polymerase sigma factor [Chitinophagaceae bacterium]|nr:sigma-70 family RNA polymerase sigma factor [Chitinophagaceae bacterium]
MTDRSVPKLVEHLFREQSGRLISVLTRIFGTENLDMAEDVVQDSLIEALRLWSSKGVPDNPAGWLFRVAKNKALNIVNREKYKRKYSSDIVHFLHSEWTAEPALNHIFSEQEILDDQLRMMFTCCHPSVSADSQVALTLKTLCGFTIPEIAKAFLTTEQNIKKRLVRARQKIRIEKVPFQVPSGNQLGARLQSVLETIYLLFNEGYSASKGNDVVRYELCEEAIRLSEIIAGYEKIEDKSDVFALLALMYLNASRFRSRSDDSGNILTMAEQDRSLWDPVFMRKGFFYLERSIAFNRLSMYHILATISAYHCAAADFASTDWKSILSLYDKLSEIDQSPLILLNRAIALSKVNGATEALAELKRIEQNPSIISYHLFYSTRAEFYLDLNDPGKAKESIEKAIALCPLEPERVLLRRKLELCK